MRRPMRWNRALEEWVYCEVPKEWRITTFEEDMMKRVNCAGCGEKVRFKDTHTSSILRDEYDRGYAVCRKCHNWERQAR